MSIEFCDPPTGRGHGGPPPNPVYVAVAAACRAHPGKWAVIRDTYATLTYQIRAGKSAAFRPPSEWDVVLRNSHHGRGDVYVRWVGDQ